MAPTEDMIAIALRTRPHAACLVPERRAERTTEGGLDVVGQQAHIEQAVRTLAGDGIRVSLFIAADREQVEAAHAVGAPVIELHTGAWCEALADGDEELAVREFERIRNAAAEAASLGLEVHAGHGLDYASAATIAALPQVVELNIGHFLIGEAVFVGLDAAVRTMRAAMDRGRKSAAVS
jgi:pyridoxine 5-phosphate synthase